MTKFLLNAPILAFLSTGVMFAYAQEEDQCYVEANKIVSSCFSAAQSTDPNRTESAEMQCESEYRAQTIKCAHPTSRPGNPKLC